MPGPFVIMIGGSEVTNYTSAKLERSKDNLTGSLSVDLFMSYVPTAPVMAQLTPGADVLVYVGGEIAFTGKVDRRTGKGLKAPAEGEGSVGSAAGETTRSVNIGPDAYTVSISVRGATKKAVDSSHRHPTTNIMQPTTKQVVDELLKGTDIQTEWLATDIKLDKVRFRDGATVWEELQRVGNENAYFMYQTRDGKIRVTDDTGRTFGDPLILGENILTFAAEQSEDKQNQTIKVKSQRTPKTVWGEEAVLQTFKIVTDSNSTNDAPINIQHYGDGTEEALERRANFEANKRTAESKDITIEVFHVVAQSAPWDIGNEHYVEVPPEGLFDVMECTGLTYEVNSEGTLKTTLTLSPLPTGGVSGGSMNAAPSPERQNLMSIGPMRRASAGITLQDGQYPATWSGPALSIVSPLKSLFAPVADKLLGLDKKEKAPSKLPPSMLQGSDR